MKSATHIRKSTREKILERAAEMFNAQGVEVVTTRHIGAAMGISQGNVHYHYPTKNAILEALFAAFLEAIRKAERFDGSAMSASDVHGSMTDALGIMYRYRFFFRDNHVVWRRLPEIGVQTKLLLANKQQEIRQLIAAFRSSAVIRAEISNSQMDFLAEQFVFTISAWLNAGAYFREKESPVAYYVDFLFRMWLPYLEPEVMADWEAQFDL